MDAGRSVVDIHSDSDVKVSDDVLRLLAFTVEGRPAPQGSKRSLGRGRMIEMSRHLGPWRDAVRAAALKTVREHRWRPMDVPHEVWITLHIQRPANPIRPWPGRGHGDVDKHARAVLDAMTGPTLVFKDDADVDVLNIKKIFTVPGAAAGAYIHVERCVP